MSLSVLAQGNFIADPQRRTASSGKPFVTATLRVAVEDGEPMLVSCITFDTAIVERLTAMGKGDALAITARGKLTTRDSKGATKHGLSIVVEGLLSVYQAGKRRRTTNEDGSA